MDRLYVLYDARCGLCRRARLWASSQPAFIELVFLPAGSDAANLRFPDLSRPGVPDELIVVSDQGEVYRGSAAWIMCLYALEDYREWSLRLASPALRPFARQAFTLVSKSRIRLSRWLHLDDSQTAERLGKVEPAACVVAAEARSPNVQSY